MPLPTPMANSLQKCPSFSPFQVYPEITLNFSTKEQPSFFPVPAVVPLLPAEQKPYPKKPYAYFLSSQGQLRLITYYSILPDPKMEVSVTANLGSRGRSRVSYLFSPHESEMILSRKSALGSDASTPQTVVGKILTSSSKNASAPQSVDERPRPYATSVKKRLHGNDIFFTYYEWRGDGPIHNPPPFPSEFGQLKEGDVYKYTDNIKDELYAWGWLNGGWKLLTPMVTTHNFGGERPYVFNLHKSTPKWITANTRDKLLTEGRKKG